MSDRIKVKTKRTSSSPPASQMESERGNFVRFMEESGVNSALIDALRALYSQGEKPDDPIIWLKNYFKQLAPNREKETLDIKEFLRSKLYDIQTEIIELKEEEQKKAALLDKLCNHCTFASSEPSIPNLADYHKVENEQLRLDTRWRIAPEPFLRAPCNDADLKIKTIKVKGVMPSFSPGEAGEGAKMERTQDLQGEYEDDGDYENEEWFRVYNIYKKTSELPNNVKLSKTTTFETDAETAEVTEEEELEAEGKWNPDRLPDNYWEPGFTLNPTRCVDEVTPISAIIAEGSECGENMDECYKSSLDNGRFVRRPCRSQMIYQDLWDIWNIHFNDPDSTDLKKDLDRPRESTQQAFIIYGDETIVPPNTVNADIREELE